MSEKQYTYAVARIRAKELSLLNDAFLEQLIGVKTVPEVMALLSEKGWKGRDNSEKQDPLDVLSYEEEKKDFHNLKAAVKETFSGKAFADIYVQGGTIDPEVIKEAASSGDFSTLPDSMKEAGKKALDTLLHYRDGQLCDIIIDKACLDQIKKASKQNKNDLIKRYGELTVALADIKTAVRGAHAKKDPAFFKEALAECDTLDITRLTEAASLGTDDIYDYLENTSYKDAVEALKKSFFAFEKWCNDALMESIRPEKAHPFTIGPLAAYILARESEISSVRMIITGKENDLPDQMIRERISRTYV